MQNLKQQNFKRRMPAEWEMHEATWIAWPHEPSDWPGKFEAIDWVYAEIARVISQHESLHIIASDQAQNERVLDCLQLNSVSTENIRIHIKATDRSWLRDSAPTAVYNNGKLEWINWKFNAWAKYDNYLKDQQVPSLVSKETQIPLVTALRPDNSQPLVLEGGAIEADGQGTLLVTEECLLSPIQERNPGLNRAQYEQAFAEYLGITKTIWLAKSCVGDDTHGHIDDVARFVAPGKVVLAFEDKADDENFESSQENLRILESSVDAQNRKLEIIKLPMPRAIVFEDLRLPASYANFYIANNVVLVPTFNDEKDVDALNILRECFPDRKVIGISAIDLVLGLGTLHCLTQQQPVA
jgi:agmatine deiminase